MEFQDHDLEAHTECDGFKEACRRSILTLTCESGTKAKHKNK